jgi:XTP/dITP diphosphohydrolase
MTDILLATANAHKLREMKEILGQVPGVEFLSLHAFPDYVPPEEGIESFEANAKLKALHAAKALGLPALADDSGLVVPALDGAPGVISARYAGPESTDKDNRKKLLEEMKRLDGLQRQAYFICVVAFATPDGDVTLEQGTCEGEILREERGGQGFGYDPLFLKHDYRKSMAELDPQVKNRISHRGRALENIRSLLETCKK